MKSGLIVLACFLISSGSLLAAAELSEGAGEVEKISEDILVVTYRTTSGTHLLLSETSKTAYAFVEVNLLGSGTASVTLDGEKADYILSSGITRITYSFDTGTAHTFVIALGSLSETYSFNVSQTVSVQELDPEIIDYLSLTESELNNEKIMAALTAFVSACVGIYAAFRIARWRAANGVETL